MFQTSFDFMQNRNLGGIEWADFQSAVLLVLLAQLFAGSVETGNLKRNFSFDKSRLSAWPIYFASLLVGGTFLINSLRLLRSNINLGFWALACFKFTKTIVHIISFLKYRPARRINSKLTAQDCTVIIPSIGNFDAEFEECVRSILSCNPSRVIVSTVGQARLLQAESIIAKINDNRLIGVSSNVANKRSQVMHAAGQVTTGITVLADDHVFWPQSFLKSATIPFQDGCVGLVGTNKRVRRTRGAFFSMSDFLNYIACIYLERHNFECTASHNIDGGVFVISGRTSLIRTHLLQSTEFKTSFLKETWFFGKVGPLNVDDDNCITPFMVRNGHKIVFHNEEDSLVETSLGVDGVRKFAGQLDRWARTTWRSNSTTLFVERDVWRSQIWSTYAVYLSSFVNLALFYDAALFLTLRKSTTSASSHITLGLVLLASKVIKPFPHLFRNPRDLLYLPLGIMFGYLHSLIRLKALLTCYNIEWGTRPAVDAASTTSSEPFRHAAVDNAGITVEDIENFPHVVVEPQQKSKRRRAATFSTSRLFSKFINSRFAFTVRNSHYSNFTESLECE